MMRLIRLIATSKSVDPAVLACGSMATARQKQERSMLPQAIIAFAHVLTIMIVIPY